MEVMTDDLLCFSDMENFPGIRQIHWNPNYNGGYREYYLIIDDQPDRAYNRLWVKFDRDPRYGRDFMVFLASGEKGIVSIALWNITTLAQFKALYELLSGVKL